MSTTTPPPKPKRRWCRFSLKTLLVVMTLFTVIVACIRWYDSRTIHARENRARAAEVTEAVAAIEKLGGTVTSEYKELRPQTWLEKQFDDPGSGEDPVGVVKVTSVSLADSEGLEHLRFLTGLQSLNLGFTDVTDFDLAQLTQMTTLVQLNVRYTQIADGGLGHLKELKRLESLNLNGTEISDEGLDRLKEIHSLKALHLNYTLVTDDGLKHLKKLALQSLSLVGNQITDVGLEHLEKQTVLQRLNLINTEVSAEGVKKLQQALPNCQIEH